MALLNISDRCSTIGNFLTQVPVLVLKPRGMWWSDPAHSAPFMNVAMPMGGGKQQQMAGIDGQEKHGQEQEQENHGHTPTSTGGNRSDWATPRWNGVTAAQVAAQAGWGDEWGGAGNTAAVDEDRSGRNEPHVSGEGGSVF